MHSVLGQEQFLRRNCSPSGLPGILGCHPKNIKKNDAIMRNSWLRRDRSTETCRVAYFPGGSFYVETWGIASSTFGGLTVRQTGRESNANGTVAIPLCDLFESCAVFGLTSWRCNGQFIRRNCGRVLRARRQLFAVGTLGAAHRSVIFGCSEGVRFLY